MRRDGFVKIFCVWSLILLMLCGCQKVQQNHATVIEKGSAGEGGVEVHYIDVGQADSILIKMPNGRTSLIDGGNRADGDLVTSYLRSNNVKKIDYLVATHPHEDHIGGLPKVISEFEIGKIYMPKKTSSTKIFKEMLNQIKKKKIKTIFAKGSDVIYQDNDLQFITLAPNSDEYDETNEYSIVNKLTFKNVSFLFTGDAEKDSEDEMLKKGYDINVDVLKVGHHGGRTSTNKAFLKKVSPSISIISCGKDNDYKHPHDETLARLKSINTQIYRTDEVGTIVVSTDGDKIYVNNDLKTNTYKELDNKEEVNTDDQNQKAQIDQQNVIGNKNSKIYHKLNASHLPSEKNQVKFKNEAEASEAGYKKCGKCYK